MYFLRDDSSIFYYFPYCLILSLFLSHRYENCWSAIQRGCNGVVFVYNPGRDDQARTLDSLYNQFAAQHGVREAQCIVFCHHKPGNQGKAGKLCEFAGLVIAPLAARQASNLVIIFLCFKPSLFVYMSF